MCFGTRQVSSYISHMTGIAGFDVPDFEGIFLDNGDPQTF